MMRETATHCSTSYVCGSSPASPYIDVVLIFSVARIAYLLQFPLSGAGPRVWNYAARGGDAFPQERYSGNAIGL